MNFASNSRQCDPDVYPDGCEPCVGPVIDPKDSKWCPDGSEGQSFQTSCKLKKILKTWFWILISRNFLQVTATLSINVKFKEMIQFQDLVFTNVEWSTLIVIPLTSNRIHMDVNIWFLTQSIVNVFHKSRLNLVYVGVDTWHENWNIYFRNCLVFLFLWLYYQALFYIYFDFNFVINALYPDMKYCK